MNLQQGYTTYARVYEMLCRFALCTQPTVHKLSHPIDEFNCI